MTFGVNQDRLWLILVMLLGFGTYYNWLVGEFDRRGYIEGFRWLSVVAGVGGTLAFLAFLNPQAALLALVCFAASGMPMIAGAVLRYMQRRADGQRAITEEVNE